MTRSKKFFYGCFILVQSLVYGVGNPLTKIAYESITPLWCLTIRFSIAFLLLMLLGGKRIVASWKRIPIKTYLPTSFCMAFAYICCNLALNFTSAINVGFLMSLPVIFVPLLERIILKKEYPKRILPIQLFVLVGLYMLCSNGGTFTFQIGDLLAIGTALFIAGALVCGEKTLEIVNPLAISATQIGVTILISFPLALGFDSIDVMGSVKPAAWGVMVYLAIACTCIAYMLQNAALQHLKATTVSLLQCTQPIFTAFVAWIILGEQLSCVGLIGSMIIVFCIILGN